MTTLSCSLCIWGEGRGGEGESVHRLLSYKANFLSLRIIQKYTAILTFESVDEILWCDHSYETSLSQLSRGNVSFSVFHKLLYCCLMWFVVDFPHLLPGQMYSGAGSLLLPVTKRRKRLRSSGEKNHNMQKNCLVKCCVSLNNFLKGQYIIQVWEQHYTSITYRDFWQTVITRIVLKIS